MRLLGLAITLLLIVQASGCSTAPFGPQLKTQVIGDVDRTLQRKAYATGVDFGTFSKHIAARKEQIDESNDHESFADQVQAALDEFDISHLSLMSPASAQRRNRGTLLGIGATTLTNGEHLLLCHVIEDGPAFAAGMRSGDTITHIDDAPIDTDAPLLGPPGESHVYRWVRDDITREADIAFAECRRASIDRLHWLEDGIALISVHTFINGLYHRRWIESYFHQVRDARGVILDLRSNKGGNTSNVRHLLGQVLPHGTPIYSDVYRRDADRYRREYKAPPPDAHALALYAGTTRLPRRGRWNRQHFDGPLVVLIDAHCGSGGDLVPAILQETGRATIIGTETMGLVRIGNKTSLSGGYLLQTPIGEMVTPAGRLLEDNPVRADIELSHRDSARDDVIIARAVRVLRDMLVNRQSAQRFRIDTHSRNGSRKGTTKLRSVTSCRHIAGTVERSASTN